MACIDRDLFLDTEYNASILKEFICPIGQGIVNDAVQLPCAHMYCKECIEMWLKEKGQCPTCQLHISSDSIRPCRVAKNMVNDATVKCEYSTCDWKGKYGDFSKHMKSCQFRSMKCPNPECKVEFLASKLNEHLLVCKFKRVKCATCATMVAEDKINDHIENKCLKRLVPCQLCGSKQRADYMEDHMTTTCSEAESKCTIPGCNSTFKLKDTDIHHISCETKHFILLACQYTPNYNSILRPIITNKKLPHVKFLENTTVQFNIRDVGEDSFQMLDLGPVQLQIMLQSNRMSRGINIVLKNLTKQKFSMTGFTQVTSFIDPNENWQQMTYTTFNKTVDTMKVYNFDMSYQDLVRSEEYVLESFVLLNFKDIIIITDDDIEIEKKIKKDGIIESTESKKYHFDVADFIKTHNITRDVDSTVLIKLLTPEYLRKTTGIVNDEQLNNIIGQIFMGINNL